MFIEPYVSAFVGAEYLAFTDAIAKYTDVHRRRIQELYMQGSSRAPELLAQHKTFAMQGSSRAPELRAQHKTFALLQDLVNPNIFTEFFLL